MDFGSGFPSGSQARIRASLGIDGAFVSKSNPVMTATAIAPNYRASGGYPVMEWEQTNGPANLKRVQMYLYDGSLGMVRYNDDGSAKDYPLSMMPSGQFGFAQVPTFGGQTPYHTGNFNPNTKANLYQADFTGTVTAPTVSTTYGQGRVQLEGGGNDRTGYVSFYNKVGGRQGYIGYADSNIINITAELGHFNFSGAPPTIDNNIIWNAGNLTPLKKFVGTITGDGAKTSFDLTHNLNTVDFTFNVKDASGYSSLVDVIPKDANTATVIMGTALDASTTRKVVIIG